MTNEVTLKKKPKRREPREIIEKVGDPELEEFWYKLPREEPVANSVNRDTHSVRPGRVPVNGKYMSIHTHPSTYPHHKYPSANDLITFMRKKDERTMVVAQIHPLGERLRGYTILRKKRGFGHKESLTKKLFGEVISQKWDLFRMYFECPRIKMMSGDNCVEELFRTLEKYDIQYRYVPNKDY